MDLRTIIAGLNQKNYALQSGLIDLSNADLTEVEQAFIQTYSPEKALIIYGTLAPDGPNHSVVAHINGNWQKGIVRGKLANKGWGADLGYYGFTPTSVDEQETIPAWILFSDELGANWPFLDSFEGSGYQRILAQFELETGAIGVGNLYALNEEKQ